MCVTKILVFVNWKKSQYLAVNRKTLPQIVITHIPAPNPLSLIMATKTSDVTESLHFKCRSRYLWGKSASHYFTPWPATRPQYSLSKRLSLNRRDPFKKSYFLTCFRFFDPTNCRHLPRITRAQPWLHPLELVSKEWVKTHRDWFFSCVLTPFMLRDVCSLIRF